MKILKKVALLGAMGVAGVAVAGSGTGPEFQTLYDTMTDWAQGVPGKMLILAMLVMAVFYSVVKPNFIMVIAAAFLGVIVYNAPDIIEQIFAATL